jgi:RHS repeat-associated protein
MAFATQNFLYDGWNPIAILNPQSTILTAFTWGSDLSGSQQGAGGVGGLLTVHYVGTAATNCFVAYDGNGNVAGLINATNGTLVANYEYGPFGEVIRQTGPMAKVNPFRFSTKYQDAESDLLYYGNRYYYAGTGTWLSRDPDGENQGFDLYGFVDNSPIDAIDYLGMQIRGPGGKGFPDPPVFPYHPVPPPPKYPEGFAICTRDIDMPGVFIWCMNQCGGEHTYVQYYHAPAPPDQGPPDLWGWGFLSGGTAPEKKFNPTTCQSCKKKAGDSRSDAQIQDCIAHHKPTHPYSYGYLVAGRYVCYDWAVEAAAACGLSCQ